MDYKKIAKENLITLFIIFTAFALGRISKINIINNQINNGPTFVNDFLNLQLVWNTGIGFGLLNLEANLFYHFISGLIAIIILVIAYICIQADRFEKISYAMVIGGAIGNLYDRLSYFAVPDFIDIHIGNYHWFTFNIADIFITIGITILLIKEFFFKKK